MPLTAIGERKSMWETLKWSFKMAATDVEVFSKHIDFEWELYEAFHMDPIPEPVWLIQAGARAQTEEYRDFYHGKRWPEIVGYRSYRGMDTPSAWLPYIPLSIATYYLPGHMLFESHQMPPSAKSGRPGNLTEMFFLPPSSDPKLLNEIEEEMYYDEDMVTQRPYRMALYSALTINQRHCVASYLNLYISYNPDWPSGKALELYNANLELWRRAEELSSPGE
jgi:hypothetical protein